MYGWYPVRFAHRGQSWLKRGRLCACAHPTNDGARFRLDVQQKQTFNGIAGAFQHYLLLLHQQHEQRYHFFVTTPSELEPFLHIGTPGQQKFIDGQCGEWNV